MMRLQIRHIRILGAERCTHSAELAEALRTLENPGANFRIAKEEFALGLNHLGLLDTNRSSDAPSRTQSVCAEKVLSEIVRRSGVIR